RLPIASRSTALRSAVRVEQPRLSPALHEAVDRLWSCCNGRAATIAAVVALPVGKRRPLPADSIFQTQLARTCSTAGKHSARGRTPCSRLLWLPRARLPRPEFQQGARTRSL